MNKKLVWCTLALGLAFILLAGCAGPEEPEGAGTGEQPQESGEGAQAGQEEEPAGPIECGTDMDCFIAAAENCEEATMARTASINLFGIITTATNHMEISENSAGDCVYFQRTDENVVEFSEELVESMLEANNTQEEIDEQLAESNEMAQMTVGYEMTCTIEPGELVTILTAWSQGSGSTNDFANADCVDNGDEIAQRMNEAQQEN
jgi:hypothetical protein